MAYTELPTQQQQQRAVPGAPVVQAQQHPKEARWREAAHALLSNPTLQEAPLTPEQLALITDAVANVLAQSAGTKGAPEEAAAGALYATNGSAASSAPTESSGAGAEAEIFVPAQASCCGALRLTKGTSLTSMLRLGKPAAIVAASNNSGAASPSAGSTVHAVVQAATPTTATASAVVDQEQVDVGAADSAESSVVPPANPTAEPSKPQFDVACSAPADETPERSESAVPGETRHFVAIQEPDSPGRLVRELERILHGSTQLDPAPQKTSSVGGVPSAAAAAGGRLTDLVSAALGGSMCLNATATTGSPAASGALQRRGSEPLLHATGAAKAAFDSHRHSVEGYAARNAVAGAAHFAAACAAAALEHPKWLAHPHGAGRDEPLSPNAADRPPRTFARPPPVLPELEIDERLTAMYERSLDWKRRCEERYAFAREEKQGAEEAVCTFSPRINPQSRQMFADGSVRYPLRPILVPEVPARSPLSPPRQQRPCSAPRGAGRAGSTASARQQPRSASAGPIRRAAAGEPNAELLSMLLDNADDAQRAGSCVPQRARGGPQGYARANARHFGGLDTMDDGTPAAVAARRLYDNAAVRRSRQEEALSRALAAERDARKWVAPPETARNATPRVWLAAALARGEISPDQAPQLARAGANSAERRARSAPRPGRSQATSELRHLLDLEVASELGKLAPRGSGVRGSSTGGSMQDAASLLQQAAVDEAAREHAWRSFIERQQACLEGRAQKVECERRRMEEARRVRKMCPGSERILYARFRAEHADSHADALAAQQQQQEQQQQQLWQQQQQAQQQTAGSQGQFLLRMEQQLDSPGSSRGGARSTGGGATITATAAAATAIPSTPSRFPQRQALASPGALAAAPPLPAVALALPLRRPASRTAAEAATPFTFKPVITAKAARRRPTSIEELSEGERLRRERKLAEARAAKEAAELEGVTFRPKLSSGTAVGAYAEVRPKLREVRTAPDAYMADLAEKQRRMEMRRIWAEREKKAQEMAECTFAPKTTPLPSYLAAQMTDTFAAAVVEERLAEIRAAHRASRAGIPAGTLAAAAFGGDSSGTTASTAAAVRDVLSNGGAEFAQSTVGSRAGSSPGDAARKLQEMREQMEKDLADLQQQWRSQQKPRGSQAAQRSSQPGCLPAAAGLLG